MQSTGFATTHTLSNVGLKLTTVKGALADALAFLGKRDKRKVGHNTYLYRTDDGARIQFHATNIMTIREGTITLNSGGFRTYTTKERLNALLPSGHALYAHLGLWHLSISGQSKTHTFADGITIGPRGKVTGAGDAAKDKALAKEIRKYAADFAKAAVEGKVEKPGPGDCWICSMHVSEGADKGKSLGDATSNVEHLRSHMSADERYYVPSLLVNAAQERDNRFLTRGGFYSLWGDMTPEKRKAEMAYQGRRLEEEIRRVLRQYLGRRFGLALR